jgi:hypothetical protein
MAEKKTATAKPVAKAVAAKVEEKIVETAPAKVEAPAKKEVAKKEAPAKKEAAKKAAPVKKEAAKKPAAKPEKKEKPAEKPAAEKAEPAENPEPRTLEKPEVTMIAAENLDPESPAGIAKAFLAELTKLMAESLAQQIDDLYVTNAGQLAQVQGLMAQYEALNAYGQSIVGENRKRYRTLPVDLHLQYGFLWSSAFSLLADRGPTVGTETTASTQL